MVNMLFHGTTKYGPKNAKGEKADEKSNRKKKKKKRRGKKKKKKDKELVVKQQKKKIEAEEQNSLSKNKWRPDEFFYDKAKVPLIIFGNSMLHKDGVTLKGLMSGVTGILYRSLKKREARCELIVTTIDEYKTSKTCSLCKF